MIGATLTGAFAYPFAMRGFLLHALAVAASTTILALVIFAIGVLDYPFTGGVRVNPKAFEMTLDEIAEDRWASAPGGSRAL